MKEPLKTLLWMNIVMLSIAIGWYWAAGPDIIYPEEGDVSTFTRPRVLVTLASVALVVGVRCWLKARCPVVSSPATEDARGMGLSTHRPGHHSLPAEPPPRS
jgi:hypothetical protein